MNDNHKQRLESLGATMEVEVKGVTSKEVDGRVVPVGTPKYHAKVMKGGKCIGTGSGPTKADAYEVAIEKAESK